MKDIEAFYGTTAEARAQAEGLMRNLVLLSGAASADWGRSTEADFLCIQLMRMRGTARELLGDLAVLSETMRQQVNTLRQDH